MKILIADGSGFIGSATRRPAISALDCGKIECAYGIGLRPWEAAAAETIDTMLAANMERGAA